jgi:proteasome lid subunit RPN8/RPN11
LGRGGVAGARVALRVRADAADAIREHGRQAYPDECCGALIARDGLVVEAFALPNTTAEGARRRFLVGPSDYRAAESRALAAGGELTGFYHSHPDHPAQPSEYDRAHAWPNLSYVIVSVRAGRAEDMTSWRLGDDRDAFEEEELSVVSPQNWEPTTESRRLKPDN